MTDNELRRFDARRHDARSGRREHARNDENAVVMVVEPLRVENSSGWLPPPTRRLPSPNRDARPDGCGVEAIIIHAISLPPGRYGGDCISDLFTNRLDPRAHPYFLDVAGLRVSSHFLVDRAGRVTQFVSVHERAWHAGVSRCLGREAVNDFSVGIELQGCDHESFTAVQYRQLAALVRGLRLDYPVLDDDRLFGHSDIAPGRKTDPGPFFDWNRFKSLLHG